MCYAVFRLDLVTLTTFIIDEIKNNIDPNIPTIIRIGVSIKLYIIIFLNIIVEATIIPTRAAYPNATLSIFFLLSNEAFSGFNETHFTIFIESKVITKKFTNGERIKL